MAVLLSDAELDEYYPEAEHMTPNNRRKYLARANAYAIGVIGGFPVSTPDFPEVPDDTIKTAVATAFEIFAEGQEAQTNPVNGNITEAAPKGYYVRKADDPLDLVNQMLQPYAVAYKKETAARETVEEVSQSYTHKGAMFL